MLAVQSYTEGLYQHERFDMKRLKSGLSVHRIALQYGMRLCKMQRSVGLSWVWSLRKQDGPGGGGKPGILLNSVIIRSTHHS